MVNKALTMAAFFVDGHDIPQKFQGFLADQPTARLSIRRPGTQVLTPAMRMPGMRACANVFPLAVARGTVPRVCCFRE